MRHKTAAVRGDDGWHYVTMSDRGGSPLGYCRNHAPHPSEADARQCYSRYLREETVKLDWGGVSWTSCSARPNGARCPNPTQSFASYGDDGYGMLPMCPDHMTVADVISTAGLDQPAGDAWVS